MKHLFFFSLLLIFNSLNAKTKEKLVANDTTQVENKSVIYKVYQDSIYLYLNVSTSDEKLAHSMIRNGLIIYFDAKGKEKENVYLKYPSKIKPPERGKIRSNNDHNTIIELESIVENIPSEAEYGFYDDKVEFNKDLNSEDISLGFTISGKLLEYNLKIPKNKILKGDKTDLSKLSIGIKTNKPERQNDQRPNESMRQGNGNRPSGGRGGGMSGGGRGGNRGGQSNGNNRQDRPTQEKTGEVKIDFWFDAKLNG